MVDDVDRKEYKKITGICIVKSIFRIIKNPKKETNYDGYLTRQTPSKKLIAFVIFNSFTGIFIGENFRSIYKL